MKKQVISRTATKSPKGASASGKSARSKAKTVVKASSSNPRTTVRGSKMAKRTKGPIDQISTAIMMVNRDFIVTYVNEPTKIMISRYAEHFREIWPNFNPDNIVGSCIDMFHKNPSHQRNMLSTPDRLPHRTRISVGPVYFSLCVNASYDDKGQYAGNILEWADVTELQRKEDAAAALSADFANQTRAILANQAVIEFTLDGTIVTANQNFLDAVGYTLPEIQGRHHSIFVDSTYKQSNEYRMFWDKLGRGEAESGQYKRIRRDGNEVWLQASYSPILDLSGKPIKVIKYATDITPQKKQEQQMTRTLAETTRVMKAMAAGDLRESMEGTFDGEFAVLKDAVNSCVDNLRNTIEQIRHSVSTMTVSSSEIATGNLDLSQRTEEQAGALTTTAANMEEITQTVKQNADNARQANSLASGAREHAEKGGAVVRNAISAMGAINEASKRIADIIGVIDEIAFQTNLLALNAAVEAARAGEQGRGFAVVASEVRNLAQRSAGAAKEIKSLIKDSVVRVEEGSRLVNESGTTLEQIVSAAKKVSDIIAEIAAASIQQSAGIEKVTESVQQMDVAVQQNSALVEQTSAASNMMEDQARSMSSLIDFFKLANTAATFATVAKKGQSAGQATSRPQNAHRQRPAPNKAPSFAAELTMGDEF